jgi:hypothetical protein
MGVRLTQQSPLNSWISASRRRIECGLYFRVRRCSTGHTRQRRPNRFAPRSVSKRRGYLSGCFCAVQCIRGLTPKKRHFSRRFLMTSDAIGASYICQSKVISSGSNDATTLGGRQAVAAGEIGLQAHLAPQFPSSLNFEVVQHPTTNLAQLALLGFGQNTASH